MRSERALKAMWRDPNMKELIESLWREYYGLYNEKYKRQAELDEEGNPIDPWLPNIFDVDTEFGQAIGQDNQIFGNKSIGTGIGHIVRSFLETALGSYSTEDLTQNIKKWVDTDRLITIGNGTDKDNRRDALLIFKSGLMKIFNAIQIGAYDHRDKDGVLVDPNDGSVQFTPEHLFEGYFDDAWHEFAFKSELPIVDFWIHQVGHGFVAGDCIKLSGTLWVKSFADLALNAGTVGLVLEVKDADNFKYQTSGLLPGDYIVGAEYFLSRLEAGKLMILEDPEIWEFGNVREFIGTGVEGGLMIEIDLGEVITEELFDDKYTYQLIFDNQTRNLTIKRSEGLTDLVVNIPPGISLVNANWNETDPDNPAFIQNKPVLSKVAISGDYTDINNPPTLVKAFTDLSDVIPKNYVGRRASVPIVTEEEDMLDLIETEELITVFARFTLLADCPQSFAGFGGYSIRVKADETGLEFYLP